jgi:signal transduction histidine kinase
MTSRRTRVRSTIAVLLISLTALWAFAGYKTLQAGLHLWSVQILDDDVAAPTNALVNALQEERRQSVGDRADLPIARGATDQARDALVTSSSGRLARAATGSAVHTALGALTARLDQLTAARSEADSSRTAEDVDAAYSPIIDAAFAVLDALPQSSPEATSQISLAQARELLAQEDTLVAGQGSVTQIAQLVGARHNAMADELGRLPGADRNAYDQVLSGSAYAALTSLETTMLGQSTLPPAATWRSTVNPVLAGLNGADQDLRSGLRDRLWPQMMAAVAELVLVIALGFVAIFASLSISIITARRLRALRDAADDLATRRLPAVVERLGQGERVDVPAEAPPLEAGRDEIGQVAAAFNRVQSTAVRVAIEQAELRRGVRDVFLSLARRSQSLLHRQLGLLDAMERRANTPQELAELFRVDHLATRMRRNAENLIVLSGATAGRTWRKSVPLVDVMRAALAEVEDYSRVTVLPPAPSALVGPAVGDVIHLLAELVENAVSYSPPQTAVRVSGSSAGSAFVIEVEDRGLGMSEAQRASANELVRRPSEFTLSSNARLGLYVVGRLAARHGITVELRESPYGGTTAVVTLPGDLITGMPAAIGGRHHPADDVLAPIGARPMTEPAAGGPVPSNPVAVAASGLPMRQRPSSPELGGAQPARASELNPEPKPQVRPEVVPLPGLSLGDEPDARR